MQFQTSRDDEGGVVLVISLFILLSVFFFAALAVDVGLLGRTNLEYKKAADLGAAAGMGWRIDNGWWAANKNQDDGTTSRQHVVTAAARTTFENLQKANLIDPTATMLNEGLGSCIPAQQCLWGTVMCEMRFYPDNDPDFIIEARYQCGGAESIDPNDPSAVPREEGVWVDVLPSSSNFAFATILPGFDADSAGTGALSSASATLKPVSVVLMLDTSGSMGCGVDEDCSCRSGPPAPGGGFTTVCDEDNVGNRGWPESGDSKIGRLRQSAADFIDRFNPNRDKIGVIAYRTVARHMVQLQHLGPAGHVNDEGEWDDTSALWRRSHVNLGYGPGEAIIRDDFNNTLFRNQLRDPSTVGSNGPYLQAADGATNIIDAFEYAYDQVDRQYDQLAEDEDVAFVLMSDGSPTAGRFRFAGTALLPCIFQDFFKFFFSSLPEDLSPMLQVANQCFDPNPGGHYLYKMAWFDGTGQDYNGVGPSPLVRFGNRSWEFYSGAGGLGLFGPTVTEVEPWLPYEYTYADPIGLAPGALNRCSVLNSDAVKENPFRQVIDTAFPLVDINWAWPFNGLGDLAASIINLPSAIARGVATIFLGGDLFLDGHRDDGIGAFITLAGPDLGFNFRRLSEASLEGCFGFYIDFNQGDIPAQETADLMLEILDGVNRIEQWVPMNRMPFILPGQPSAIPLPLNFGLTDEYSPVNFHNWELQLYNGAVVWSDYLRNLLTTPNGTRKARVYTIGLGSPINSDCNKISANQSPLDAQEHGPLDWYKSYQCLFLPRASGLGIDFDGLVTQAHEFREHARKDILMTRIASDRNIWCNAKNGQGFHEFFMAGEDYYFYQDPTLDDTPLPEECPDQGQSFSSLLEPDSLDGTYLATNDPTQLGALFAQTARNIQLSLGR